MNQILRIMKLTTFLLFVLFFQVSAGVFSQNNGNLTLKAEKESVNTILKLIEENSDFRFLFNSNNVDVERKIDINVSSKSIEEVLKQLFEGTNVKFRSFNAIYVLYTEDGNLPANTQQQQKNITGKVTDNTNSPLPGVSVVVKGTTTGTITDFDGNYSLASIPANATLQFSFVGMKTQEVALDGKTKINITMTEENIGIEEVVAIGYGTMKKKDLTGAVSSVQGDMISKIPASTISQALQGRLSGVEITQNSGAPGADLQIRIRGTNSISGDNQPLWIIDGFPAAPSSINVSDIESIDVLKDASATAIYGSRGANGVIIVTTKSGKSGETKVDYEGSLSFQKIIKKLPLMNTTEYMLFYNNQQLNDNGKEYFSQEQINNAGTGTDWQDLMFRTAPINDHSLSVSGGNGKTRFLLSGSYLNQAGILVGNMGYERISLRTNIEHDISKVFNIQFNTILTRLKNDKKAATGHFGQFANLLAASPTLSPYNEDGSYANSLTQYPFSYGSQTNMMMWANEEYDIARANKVYTTLALTIKPLEGLSIKISGNVLNSDVRNDSYESTKFLGSSGSAGVSTSQDVSLSTNNIITYDRTFNQNHHITFMGATTYEQDIVTSLRASARGFLSDNYETYNLGAGSDFPAPSSGYSKWSLLSYLGRINYSYKDKYLLTTSYRADGSSRYSVGNKWGYFPSGAFAWRISKEDFMKDFTFISNLKLRGGYGETGSTAIIPYSTLSMLSTGKVPFNKDSYTYFAPKSVLPGDLKWETTAQTDAGLDLGLFGNRLNLTVDYYIKNTRDLLNTVQMPRSSGYTSTIQNIGKIQNKGFEFLLDGHILNGNFKWNEVR